MGIRYITWRRWTTYLAMRLLLVAFTIVILEAVSETTKYGFVWLALVPTILVLLVPCRVPRQRKNPVNAAAVASVCTVDATFGSDAGCLGLVDDQQAHWCTADSLRDLVTTNRVTLYRAEFGWTPNSHPTQSPSAFLERPHLNEFAYTLSPVTQDSCVKYPSNGQ